MMSQGKPRFEEEMQRIVAAIHILSPTSFEFAGEHVDATQAPATGTFGSAQNPAMVMQLQQQLYQRCYCVPLGSRSPDSPMTTSNPNFLAWLSQANLSRSRWDSNWRVSRVENTGQVWAEKAGVMRIFQPGEFVNYAGAGTPVRAGNSISVYLFKESTTMQPGCYFAFGETAAASDNLDIFRLYWDIDETGVLSLLQSVTRDLNRFQVPFQFKCPVWPQGYMRRDAAVLYVRKRFYSLVRELAAGWRQECAAHIRNDVPLFALALEPGLGLAEDPESGESFGMNRCRHVAEAIWNAHSSGVPEAERLRAVKEHFRQHGLDFNRPYLNPGSVDQYWQQAAA
jgi:hypothetical protein